MSKPAAIHADLTAAQIQERIDALTAKLGAVLDARKAAHVHAAIEPSAWIERCACGARRVVVSVTSLVATRQRRTVTAFWRLDPHPTPDPAGLARWIDRAHRLLASGQIGLAV